MMTNSWSTPVEKLMIWRTNTWMKYDFNCENIALHLHCDQVLITSDLKVLESFNLNNKMKGIYKQDILILFSSSSGNTIRKIKFKIKENVAECLQKLGDYFPIMSFNGSKSSIPPKYQDINEIFLSFSSILKSNNDFMNMALPTEYISFIKLCLLDPSFPHVVIETEKALTSIFRKQN